MPVRLFVAKLPFNTTEADLRQYFSQVGSVSAVILPVDRETGKKRGFAFIDFQDKATAQEAIRRLNNGLFNGQAISVSEARPREEKHPGTRPGGPYLGGLHRQSRSGGEESGSAPDRKAGWHDDAGEGRPSRRFQSARKGSGRKSTNPGTPRGPIPERRSGRLHDLGEDDYEPKEVEFENLATSAPPGEDDVEE